MITNDAYYLQSDHSIFKHIYPHGGKEFLLVDAYTSGYLHVGYDCFFTEYVGLAVGVDFGRYGSVTRMQGVQEWEDVLDTDDFLGLGTGFRDDRAGYAEAHYFMDGYGSLLFSPLAQGIARPWHVGLEAGLRYTIPYREKAQPCRCVEW